jgi:hypothetical protein
VVQNAPAGQPRVLVVCHRDSAIFGALGAVLAARQGWHAFLVSERFRQLPMLARLYGPTHLVVDLSSAAAVWDQLGSVSTMPERRRMEVIGVSSPGALDPRRRREVDVVVACGPHLLADLERCLGAARQAREQGMAAAGMEVPLSAAS